MTSAVRAAIRVEGVKLATDRVVSSPSLPSSPWSGERCLLWYLAMGVLGALVAGYTYQAVSLVL